MSRFGVKVALLLALYVLQAQAQTIDKLEYFIDTDPGYGIATEITIAPDSSAINELFEVDLSNLESGFHALFVRVMDDSGRWSLANAKPFYLEAGNILGAGNITAVEYFFDIDPDYGHGIDVPIDPGNSINQLFTVDLSGLPSGFHALFVRARDSNGFWSLANAKPFYLEEGNVSGAGDISAIEYFIDTDPGYGFGTSVTFTRTGLVDQLFAVDLSGLGSGFHALFVRVRDSNGSWSLSNAKPFYLDEGNIDGIADITAVEYYVDNDPGYGNAFGVPFDKSASINQLSTVNLDSLSSGFHALFVRVRDSNGIWSLSNAKPFYLEAGSIAGAGDITAVEYFIDTDPGYGLGTSFSFEPYSAINQPFQIDLSTLENGFHALFVRVRDSNGFWSLANAKPFYLDNQDIAPPKIVSFDYQIVDGNGTPVETVSFSTLPAPDVTTEILVNLDSLTIDEAYDLHLVARDEHNRVSFEAATPIMVAHGAYIHLSAETLDFGYVKSGEMDSLLFTVYNDGDSTLEGTVSSGVQDFIVRQPTLEIVPGDSALLTIVFAPADSQRYATSLAVITNAKDWPQIDLPMAGLATNAVPLALMDFLTLNEDEPASINVVLNDADDDSDPLRISAIHIFSGAEIEITGDSTLLYIPEQDFNGIDSLFYIVTDNHDTYDSAYVYITVLPVNDKPGDFTMLSIPGDSVILVTEELLDDNLTFIWTAAADVEGDTVFYQFDYAGITTLLPQQVLTDTMVSVRYDSLVVWIQQSQLTSISGSWNLFATDRQDTTWLSATPFTLTIDLSTLDLDDLYGIPEKFALHQNYPNPFNPTANIRFDLPETVHTSLIVYDVLGRQVISILDRDMAAGYHLVQWDGRDNTGRSLASGLYFARLITPDYTKSIKMLLLK
ncbi:Ig-like domain-containing protein [Candidatus Neomarinimicrobiota bacterium]